MAGDATARQAIEAQNQKFMALFKAGDVVGFARLYTEDALVMVPNAGSLAGRMGAAKFMEGLKGRGVAAIKLSTHELETFGDTAWERGSAETLLANGDVAGRSRFIVIWKRTAEGWQLHRDIMNAEAPPPAAASRS